MNNNNNSNTKNRLNGNKFTPDTDFVADFGSASIFNGSATNGKKLLNGSGGPLIESTLQQNGQPSSDNANADFADFDHNPIYNAAGKKKKTLFRRKTFYIYVLK